MELKEIALTNFNNGYNCAQAVISPFITKLEIPENAALAIASGYGSGMGGTQGTCGALTGAYMVLGMQHAKLTPTAPNTKDTVKDKVQELHNDFNQKFGTTLCKKLTQADFSTPEGKEKFTREGGKKNICEKCVAFTVAKIEASL